MSDLEFAQPVLVRSGRRHLEIDGVNEALTFLMTWPRIYRTGAFDYALTSCEGALEEVVTAEEAREAFSEFVDISRVATGGVAHEATTRIAAHPNLAH